MIKQHTHWIIAFMLLFSALEGTAQIDSVSFTSGDFIVGEVKNMKNGILQVETDYSDSDFKYELPLDFFIKVGLSLNYDNRPADGASEIDYVFQTGFGWEW